MKNIIFLISIFLSTYVCKAEGKSNFTLGDQAPSVVIEQVHKSYKNPPENFITYTHKLSNSPYWMVGLVWGETLFISNDGLAIVSANRGRLVFSVYQSNETNYVDASSSLSQTYSSKELPNDVEEILLSAIKASANSIEPVDLSRTSAETSRAYNFKKAEKFWYLKTRNGDAIIDTANKVAFFTNGSKQTGKIIAFDSSKSSGIVVNDLGMKSIKKQALTMIDQTIDFNASEAKQTVYVFTDPYCGYCIKLHRSVNSLNDRGITIKYIPINNFGDRSKDTVLRLLSVNPSEQNNAMDYMKEQLANRKALDYSVIGASSISEAAEYQLNKNVTIGKALGVHGTPSVFDLRGEPVVLEF